MVCVSTAADMVRADLFTEPTVTEIHMCFNIPEERQVVVETNQCSFLFHQIGPAS